MDSHETVHSWSPAVPGDETPTKHATEVPASEATRTTEDVPSEAAAIDEPPVSDGSSFTGTDYAGTVDEPLAGVIEEDVAVVATDEPVAYDGTALASAGRTTSGSEHWSEVKAMFVDDPAESVKRAAGLVERAVDDLMASVRQRQEALDSPWESGVATGTEELRNALRAYRSLFEQLDQLSSEFPADQDRAAGRAGRQI